MACLGCGRTTTEIEKWGLMSPEQRIAVERDLPGRVGILWKLLQGETSIDEVGGILKHGSFQNKSGSKVSV